MISKGNVKFTDSEVRMASRFASSTQQEIEKLLEDKDTILFNDTFFRNAFNFSALDCFIKTVKICLSLNCTFLSIWKLTVIAAIMRLSLFSSNQCIIKQLLDPVFVISGIIKVSVSVIILSLGLRQITLTSTLIIPDITKTSSNNCLMYFTVIKKCTQIFFFMDSIVETSSSAGCRKGFILFAFVSLCSLLVGWAWEAAVPLASKLHRAYNYIESLSCYFPWTRTANGARMYLYFLWCFRNDIVSS